jgi:transcription-repair coupling factor (superfamily II helicase)
MYHETETMISLTHYVLIFKGVLASQHLKNILQRMGPDSPFNFSIALLRGGMGKNTKAGKALRDDISKGNVNIVVGTHALLSSDLNFQDLGLLIVDEEQRFGVKQKER